MTRILLLTASLIAATSGQAFGYSNVSPKEPLQVTAVDHNALDSSVGPEHAYAFTAHGYHYRGGPKAND